jgi:hypothetical protein
MSTERCLAFVCIHESLSMRLLYIKYRAYMVCFKRVLIREKRRIFEVAELVSALEFVLMVIS